MLENNENLVTEVTENVETTPTEESVVEQAEAPAEKTFTQSEVNEIVKGAKARAKAQVRKEYDRKLQQYGDLEEVLKAGTGKQSVEEMTNGFKEFYASKGVKLPEKPRYSDKDIEVLAKAEAEEVIRSGYDEVVEEVDRLASLGVEKMTPRDRAYFNILAKHRETAELQNELQGIGVTEDEYNSKEFQEFKGKFNSATPVSDIWNIYQKTLPKKEVKSMGSMKSTAMNEVKDFYSPEEISRLTEDDLRDPDVWNAVRRSMTGKK